MKLCIVFSIFLIVAAGPRSDIRCKAYGYCDLYRGAQPDVLNIHLFESVLKNHFGPRLWTPNWIEVLWKQTKQICGKPLKIKHNQCRDIRKLLPISDQFCMKRKR